MRLSREQLQEYTTPKPGDADAAEMSLLATEALTLMHERDVRDGIIKKVLDGASPNKRHWHNDRRCSCGYMNWGTCTTPMTPAEAEYFAKRGNNA